MCSNYKIYLTTLWKTRNEVTMFCLMSRKADDLQISLPQSETQNNPTHKISHKIANLCFSLCGQTRCDLLLLSSCWIKMLFDIDTLC